MSGITTGIIEIVAYLTFVGIFLFLCLLGMSDDE